MSYPCNKKKQNKSGLNFSRGKRQPPQNIGHFSLIKFYTSQVSQKAFIIPCKFCFKNRKLINSQVNWFIKINVNAQVFSIFFTTTVSVIDQIWLINAAQPYYGMINLITFFKDFRYLVFIREKN